MTEATDRVDRNARAALTVLEMERITPKLMAELYRTLGELVAEAAYDIAYAMEAECEKRIERGQVWPIDETPHDDNLPRLPAVLSAEQMEAICLERFPGFAEIENAENRKSCYDAARDWHGAMLKALSKPEPAEPAKPTSQGMAFPVRVSGCPPHDGLLFPDVGSIEFLGRIASSYQLKEIGFFVRDDNNVDWIPDGLGGYKRKLG